MTARLLLIDALNIAYRAFYGIPPLTTKSGRPTQAVYGFIKTLMQMERLWQPSHHLVAFDGGLPPERLEMLPDYKAQRPAMPADLRSQLPDLEVYLDRAAIPHIRLEGREADDIIATLARRAADAGLAVMIASSDKDLLQLVNERITVVSPAKVEAPLGPAEVVQKTGVQPGQIVDWLALTGDSSDNVPGVPGVGAKTAARWLNQWGSLAALWEHVADLKPPALQAALQAHRDIVERNVRMVRLQQDLAGLPPLADLACRPSDPAGLKAFFEAMDFQTLIKTLPEPTLFDR